MGLRENAEAAAVLQTTANEVTRLPAMARIPATPGYDTDGEGNELGDVSESGVPVSSRSAPVHVAWQRMMQDVQWLGKGRQARDYAYRGIDDVMNLVGPAERKHGVFVMPTGIQADFTTINTKSGAVMNYCRATVQFTIYGPGGDSMQATVLGEAFDNGDKSGTKAQSIALRTLYLNALAIQTNEPARDTEYGEQHELAGPVRPTPEQYADMIQDPNTSLARLTQMKEELYGDRALGSTMVDVNSGGQERLVDLVRRVGQLRRIKEGS